MVFGRHIHPEFLGFGMGLGPKSQTRPTSQIPKKMGHKSSPKSQIPKKLGLKCLKFDIIGYIANKTSYFCVY